MALVTLNVLVLATVQVGNVKLPTPADRIGAGLVDFATYPTTNLSQGQIPLPRLPEPIDRSRQEVIEMQTMHAMPPAGGPASSAGSSFGESASHRGLANTSFATPAGASRVNQPWTLDRWCDVGGDCQSPDAHGDFRGRDAKPETVRQRTVTRAAAAAK
jgi:hypothetical protein